MEVEVVILPNHNHWLHPLPSEEGSMVVIKCWLWMYNDDVGQSTTPHVIMFTLSLHYYVLSGCYVLQLISLCYEHILLDFVEMGDEARLCNVIPLLVVLHCILSWSLTISTFLQIHTLDEAFVFVYLQSNILYFWSYTIRSVQNYKWLVHVTILQYSTYEQTI